MTASVTSPTDLGNLALARIGFKGRIGSLLEGSMAARKMLDVYAQTRDAVLAEGDLDFSSRSTTLTLLKSAPVGGYIPPAVWSTAFPALPWKYEYGYPPDAVKVRAVRFSPIFTVNFDPQPNPYMVANDEGLNPPQKVILTNVPSAILVYTGQITDLTTWTPDAIEAFAAALGRRIAPALANMDVAKALAVDEAQAMDTADMEQE